MKFKPRDYFSFTSHSAFGSGLFAWLKVLSQNNFSIHPFFLPKAFFISGAIILSTPFRWYEQIKFRNKIKDAEIKNPVFILGHPRSGTTFLHYMMGQDPAFGYCTTTQAMIPHMFLTRSGFFSGLLSKALPKTRPMDNLKMGSDLPKEEEFALIAYGPESMVTGYYFPQHFTKNFEKNVLFENNQQGKENWKKNFDHFLRKLTISNPGKKLLMKSPANTARVKEILELYPDAKFIHIYRNPFDVIQSHLHLFNKLLPMLSFQNIDDLAIEEIVFSTYIKLHKKYFNEMSLIPKQNLVELKYEDFVVDPLVHLKKIYASISLNEFEKARPFLEEEFKKYCNYHKNKFNMSGELAEKISSRLRFAFDRFGYSTDFRHG
ncbi:sulfotransferase [soil metagenome]